MAKRLSCRRRGRQHETIKWVPKEINNKTAQRTEQITTAPIGPLLLRLTLPMIVGIFCMMFLGVADTFFISLLGTTQLAAASFVMSIYMLTVSMALGIGMGLGSLNARLVGERKMEQAARFITDAQLFTLVFAICAAGLTYLLIDPLFGLLGADAAVMPYIKSYMHVILFGTPFIMLTMVANNALRSVGNTRASAICSSILSLLNLLLDPLLIFGLGPFPALGMRGAALATVIAAIMSWLYSLFVLKKHENLLDFSRPELARLLSNWRRLMTIAVPAIGANIMTPLAAAIMTAIIARFGAEAVAGFGVGVRIESFSLIIVFALSSTLPMFIGQNIGAGKAGRAYAALTKCLYFTLILQAGIYLLVLALAAPLADGFSDNAQVIYVIKLFLLILPLTYGAHGLVILIMVSLNVLQRPRMALLISIIRLLCLYLPLAYGLSLVFGLEGLFAGAALGNVIASVIAYRIIKKVCLAQGLVPVK